MIFRKPFLLINLLFLMSYGAEAQSNYDIQLSLNSVDCNNNVVCYDVQLRSNDESSWNLAGQNYRLYYDASLGTYQSGASSLGGGYQNFTLVQNIQNIDASGTGSLAFENNLSFLNYSIDLSNTSTGGINLPVDGSWLTTSQLCFSVQPSLLNDSNTCFEAIWARNGLTEPYATSFVEVSEWVAAENTQMANGVGYNDLTSTEGEASCLTNSCSNVGRYDLQMSLNQVDCNNNIVCYDVQLRSNDGKSWNLAGQNYRLFYDGTLGSYRSGISVLNNADYTNFILVEDVQHQNAIGTGSLTFEDNLSFLNYTIDLTNTAAGGVVLPADGSWITTSQLCFDVHSLVLTDSNSCFEAIWSRTGLTDAYATSFVEISEWVAAENTQMANGIGYDDLTSSDGDDACLVSSCRFDYGDLQDSTNISSSEIGYATYQANNGPRHLIIDGLALGDTVDMDINGLPSDQATGDDEAGIDDEEGIIIFPSLNIYPGGKIRVPLTYTNLTGDTAYIEAWIDWNGNGSFLDANELVFDVKDASSGLFSFIEINIPSDALSDQALGFRIRISNQDNMTPYGSIGSGEVEDYQLQVSCSKKIGLPFTVNSNN